MDVLDLSGSAYERGFEHGRRLGPKIRSLYTQMLTTSILPFLNRLQADIEEVLVEYKKPLYSEGQFSYQVLLQSAQNVLPQIPEPYVEELRGMAAGSAVDFDQLLVMNTFVDSMMNMRSIAFFLNQIQAPRLVSVTFDGSIQTDGRDNNGDGAVDEIDEGAVDPYEPTPYALMTEVPTDASIRMVIQDQDLGADGLGVDPETIRIQLNTDLYVFGDPSITTRNVDSAGEILEVVFTPPGGLPPASVVSLLLQAGDRSIVTDPPPAHARFMRDERFVFSTAGYGKPPQEIENRGERDNRTQPPSLAFALRGSATSDGHVLAAQHFALLDNNAMHKHGAILVHRPDDGFAHVVPAWSGLWAGFSGMNSEGLVYLANTSDTLNNSIVGEVKDKLIAAKLLASGLPIEIVGREILSRSRTTADAIEVLRTIKVGFGWNILLADRTGDLAMVELDADIQEDGHNGFHVFRPDAASADHLDAWGRLWASVGLDDIRAATHYRKNADDVGFTVLGFEVRPQRFWSTFYYRSLRAYYLLGEEISRAYGSSDLPSVKELLRAPELIDQRDSMNAAIYEPEALRLHYAMGQVPATSGPFVEFNFGAAIGESFATEFTEEQ